MNYTGNPRHYRSHPGPPSALKGYFRRQCALLERPLLAICQEFQDPSPDTGTDAKSPLRVSCISTEQETFETKRRRILHQKDWLGLDISSPINVSVIARSILIIRYTRYEMPRNSDVAPTVRSWDHYSMTRRRLLRLSFLHPLRFPCPQQWHRIHRLLSSHNQLCRLFTHLDMVQDSSRPIILRQLLHNENLRHPNPILQVQAGIFLHLQILLSLTLNLCQKQILKWNFPRE